MFPRLLEAVQEIECDAGETRKMLWRAVDGTTFESVLMRYPQRNTVCISSQAGCGMACPFCATGQGGLKRNLSTAEILEQVRSAAVELRDRDHGKIVEHRVHGHGRAAGQLQPGARGGSPDHRGAAERLRHLGAFGDGVDGRSRPRDPQAGRRAARGHAGAVAACSRRRAPRHPGAGEQPVEGLRGARRRPLLRRRDGSAGIDRVRVDPRRQRPAVAGRPTRQAAARRAGAAGARQPHSAEPDAGQRVGRQPQGRRAGVRQAGARAGVSCTVRDTRGREIAAACGQLAAQA